MSKDPAVLFYTSDFLSGTSFFTDEQRGQYIRLLCEQHQNGHIPEEHMINICKSYDSPVMRKFIKDPDGLFYNERMEKEVLRRRNYSTSRKENRLGKRNKEQSYDSTYDQSYDTTHENHVSVHMETGNITGIIETDTKDKEGGAGGRKRKELNIPFDVFWQMYDKKVDRGKCEPKWSRLSDNERVDCMARLPEYVNATPDKTFRRDPETYLNNKSWENEIVTKSRNGKPKTELQQLYEETHLAKEIEELESKRLAAREKFNHIP